MTNAEIIFRESCALVKAGVIGTTGRQFEMEDAEGNKVLIPEPEPIHTFACWKDLGFSVKKGEHAVAKFMIWKGSERPVKDEDGNETGEKKTRLFMKQAFFFTAGQVEPTADRPARPARKSGKTGSRKTKVAKADPVAAPVIADPAAGYGSWLS